MTSILVYKPERHPGEIQTTENVLPVIPPKLSRSVILKKLINQDHEGLSDYLYDYSFIKKVKIQNNQLYVKVFVDKVDYVYEQIQRIFRYGIPTLSTKIWKIEVSNNFMTSLEAEKFINKDFCSNLNYYICCDTKYDYITYIIYMH
tara:strand:- start:165 stop:602 length:438 start_codon:yes stop_codon:yes gene_type:complete